MAKLTIRTIELDLDDDTLPEITRNIIASVTHANGKPLEALPAPSVQVYETEPEKPAKPRKQRAAASKPAEPTRRLGRPPKVRSEEPASQPPAKGGLGDRIETLMMQAGMSVSTTYLAARMRDVDLKNIKRALGQGVRYKRFVHDPSDDTYSLADVR